MCKLPVLLSIIFLVSCDYLELDITTDYTEFSLNINPSKPDLHKIDNIVTIDQIEFEMNYLGVNIEDIKSVSINDAFIKITNESKEKSFDKYSQMYVVLDNLDTIAWNYNVQKNSYKVDFEVINKNALTYFEGDTHVFSVYAQLDEQMFDTLSLNVKLNYKITIK